MPESPNYHGSPRTRLTALSLLLLTAAFSAGGRALAVDAALQDSTSPLDPPAFDDLLEHTLFDLEDLFRLALETRRLYAPLIPPWG